MLVYLVKTWKEQLLFVYLLLLFISWCCSIWFLWFSLSLILKISIQWLTEKHKKALFEALEKIKAGNIMDLDYSIVTLISRSHRTMRDISFYLGCVEWHINCAYLTFDANTAELMILGFISLLLTFGQSYIARICLPAKVLNNMLPCKSKGESESTTSTEGDGRRRLLWLDRRFLAAGSNAPNCKTVSVF